MDNNEKYFTELALAMAERTIKRLWILCITIFVAFVLSNACWLVYENSFEDMTITQENEDGYNNFIGNDGDINYGETDN